MATAAHSRQWEFNLRPGWRTRLDRLATAYFAADRADDRESKVDIRREIAGPDGLVGCGAGRDVFELPDESHAGSRHGGYVVKFPVTHRKPVLRGIRQNRREIRTWRATRARAFMPVVAANGDGWWLVMPRGEEIGGEEARTGQFNGWIEEVTTKHGDRVDERDVNRKNAVRLDGEYRLCDYGWPSERSHPPNTKHRPR